MSSPLARRGPASVACPSWRSWRSAAHVPTEECLARAARCCMVLLFCVAGSQRGRSGVADAAFHAAQVPRHYVSDADVGPTRATSPSLQLQLQPLCNSVTGAAPVAAMPGDDLCTQTLHILTNHTTRQRPRVSGCACRRRHRSNSRSQVAVRTGRCTAVAIVWLQPRPPPAKPHTPTASHLHRPKRSWATSLVSI